MAEIIALDDVYDAVILIRKILSKQGHNVHTFTEEEEAVDFVSTHPADLAILDIKLKKMSGIEVLAQMKKVPPEIRAIMLTGYPTVETAREAMSLGANEYCVKPIDKDELEEKVSKVLGGDKLLIDDAKRHDNSY
jgi:DNA-binding NtrC family response regulator